MRTVRELLARLWTSLWPRGPVGRRQEPDQISRSRGDARSRFWTELREGQREAEAHSSRLRS
jgi:hypothetical protein